MITYLQAIILGLSQGVTELFPISSLGHSVLLPYLLDWHLSQSSNIFLVFLIFTHLATALVLFGFFLKDWKLIITGIFRSIKIRAIRKDDTYALLGWRIIVATIPVGIFGILFEEKFKQLFSAPKIISGFLILNAGILYFSEVLKNRQKKLQVSSADNTASDEEIAKISWWQSIKIGLAESLALFPGISRTGSTIGGGILTGLNHENSARFSFLLATPVIFAAAVLKLPDLISADLVSQTGPIIVGAIASGIGAFFSVKFLTKYFENSTLRPFAVYCLLVGVITLILL
ncbi:MAG: undecaprenyl-diphosphate phosphatase [bacterium]